MKAVVLLSGGLDSTTCLAIAKHQGFECHVLSFDYQQRHKAELHAAKKIAKHMGAASHQIVNLAIHQWGGSALTDTHLTIPEDKVSDEIPITYVPARNTLFLAYALSFAEAIGAYDIFIGVSQIDFSNYPDCRPAFIEAFETLANLATKAGVERQAFKMHTPLMHLSKAETIKAGVNLGVDYQLTVSCYQADDQGLACGKCHSCQLRQKGFQEAGLVDATNYQKL